MQKRKVLGILNPCTWLHCPENKPEKVANEIEMNLQEEKSKTLIVTSMQSTNKEKDTIEECSRTNIQKNKPVLWELEKKNKNPCNALGDKRGNKNTRIEYLEINCENKKSRNN